MKAVGLIHPSGTCECMRMKIIIIIGDLMCSICLFFFEPESISVEKAAFIQPRKSLQFFRFKRLKFTFRIGGFKRICRGGFGNFLRADHHILKQAFLLEGWSSIDRALAHFPRGAACNPQPDLFI